MILRYSTEKDKDSIDALIKLCFGNRPAALTDIKNRYLLAVNEEIGRVVGMTGICESDYPYKGLEVDWTCVHPDYRRRGVVSHLLEQVN